ncbi:MULTISPECIES: hypothetical protein [Mucilaginibacter]|uniref:Uncharacterized protein n=1 Tax=Mucilaginibacter rubeus TaxID=2027860 RepID=A0ABX7U7K7_9SPHI|nr:MULTISPECIES: hypothetical protein [Mucilaginibacter]QTE41977.1 hypothetical protein J3L19_24005 [Mucilaginibacter rubeus]QTE48578.1 hypothetical protein J3L21_23985 [Mucilaginibacter rubeus]QTE59965.1 hypothetical protein J3L23_15620 [Mucilaginibacter rubeus]QTE60569.1 hypothetical protein J3L22_18220 [Mucilaginibacter rubeus]QTF59334.1 hypothetical protein J3L20_17885 [Mucilaginibacter rubeus]
MKKFIDLNLGFNDAENFKERQSKELLVRYFIKTDELYSILKPNNYFLIGDKGTGKTAYSLFLSNLEFKNTHSHLNYIRETEYVKFIKLKAEKHLTLPSWREYAALAKSVAYS